jgi:hypothetical protein
MSARSTSPARRLTNATAPFSAMAASIGHCLAITSPSPRPAVHAMSRSPASRIRKSAE